MRLKASSSAPKLFVIRSSASEIISSIILSPLLTRFALLTLSYQGAVPLAHDVIQQRARAGHVKNLDGNLVIATQTDRGEIHHAKLLINDFIIGKLIEFFCIWCSSGSAE